MNNPPQLPLIVENLSFGYRDREELAIREINFSANPGEVLLVAALVLLFMGYGSFWVPVSLIPPV